MIVLLISAVLDAINHATLLHHLHCDFGIAGAAFDWIKSYLSNRKRYVKFDQFRFVCTPCTSGVQQGSVLGPIRFALYDIYVAPVGYIISAYGIQHHQYADDTQLFFALKDATIVTDIYLLDSLSPAVKRLFLGMIYC